MKCIPNKGAGDCWDNSDLNSIKNETLNAITEQGKTCTLANQSQLSETIQENAVNGDFYTSVFDGTDTYNLTQVQNNANAKTNRITSYFNGMRLRFEADTTYQDTNYYVDVDSLGQKEVIDDNNNDGLLRHGIGETSYIEAVYNLIDDKFYILKNTKDAMYISNIYSLQQTENVLGYVTVTVDFSEGSCIDSGGNFQTVTRIKKYITNNGVDWTAGDNQPGVPSGISLTSVPVLFEFELFDANGNSDAGFDTDVNASNLLANANVLAWAGGSSPSYRRVGVVTGSGTFNSSWSTLTSYCNKINDKDMKFNFQNIVFTIRNTTTTGYATNVFDASILGLIDKRTKYVFENILTKSNNDNNGEIFYFLHNVSATNDFNGKEYPLLYETIGYYSRYARYATLYPFVLDKNDTITLFNYYRENSGGQGSYTLYLHSFVDTRH